VFDTLYGIDTEWKAQPQMVEDHTVENDGLTWTLKLRDCLRFHDKEPVLARDVVASIRRFAPRVIFANALVDATDELSAPDDRTVRFRLKRPFPHLPEALAGPGGNVPVIMPERLAAESPYKPVAESSAAAPTASSMTSISAAPARSSSDLRSINRGRVAGSGSPPGRR
jgi:peptide/nickel transport system substrate-binding protein